MPKERFEAFDADEDVDEFIAHPESLTEKWVPTKIPHENMKFNSNGLLTHTGANSITIKCHCTIPLRIMLLHVSVEVGLLPEAPKIRTEWKVSWDVEPH